MPSRSRRVAIVLAACAALAALALLLRRPSPAPPPPPAAESAPAAPPTLRGAPEAASTTAAPSSPPPAERKPAARPAPRASEPHAAPVGPPAQGPLVAGETRIVPPARPPVGQAPDLPTGLPILPLLPVDGQIEFDVHPAKPKPGRPYNVRVYLRNTGRKAIAVKSLLVSSEMNGRTSRGAVTPRSREVPPQQVALLVEIPGVWKADVRSWRLGVEITSTRGEILRNELALR